MKTELMLGDCLERMKEVPDKSVDMCLTDPPYGTTACKWDTVIPFEPMWKELHRIVKDNGAICLFGSEPFSSHLRMSNIKRFKYDWIWQKEKGGNIGALKYQPSKTYEIISIFSKKTHFYKPIMDKRLEKNKRNNKPRTNKSNIQGSNFYTEKSRGNLDEKYPIAIRQFNSVRNGLHPTQKPVALLEYLIKTYTLEGETVLDFTAGSFSTGVACANLNRGFIGIEKDKGYFRIGIKRIKEAISCQGPKTELVIRS
jgi:site-specific DNA-methyltransferase (adenine-specific)